MNILGYAGNRLNAGSAPESPTAMREAARYMLRLREAAKSHFDPMIRSEAAWNLMLALYALDKGPNGCHIGSVAERAHLPRTTALRWLIKLQDHGFISLTPDRTDRRAIRVRVTRNGLEAMRRSFVAARFATR